jgi:thiol-disulfide isomerase/thioredoxin
MNFAKVFTGLLLAAATSLALAGESKPYTAAEFDKLAQAGQPVLVEVTAPWCPTCKAQKPIIEELTKRPTYQSLTVLTIDFDSQKALLKQYKVGMQSTLIAFKGGKEAGRSVGDTTAAGIEDLFKKATH